MLSITTKKRSRKRSAILIIVAVVTFVSGVYLLLLLSAPTIMPIILSKKVTTESIGDPTVGSDRVVIPKINVDVPYSPGEQALNDGAEWRWPDRGNPVDGGNFILAAHRFSLAATPWQTYGSSPFYHIDKLVIGDKIIVDYDGKRYGYTVDKIYDVKPTQTEIEAVSETPKLTLYTCSLGGSSDGRVVIEAKPMGEITVTSSSSSNS